MTHAAPPPSHCIVVIQTGDNSAPDAYFTLFETSVTEGVNIIRFYDTRNGPNTGILKLLGAKISKNFSGHTHSMIWKPAQGAR